jgi:hypothetical protein
VDIATGQERSLGKLTSWLRWPRRGSAEAADGR